MPNLLNGIQCDNFEWRGKDSVEFSLTCTYDEAASIRAPLVVTDGGETVASFEGMEPMGVWSSGESFRLRASRELTDQAEQAIHALETNLTALTSKVGTVETTAAEAKETAEGAAASASPSVRAASALYVNASTTLTNSELGDVRELIKDFERGAEYAKGVIRKYGGKFYRMAQKIDSTTSQTYQPGEGTESLYTLIDLAPDGIRIWHTVTDSTNSFALGEKCHHPGEDGPVYVSKRDGNTSEPGTDEWWELAE